jgi:hypothetical protein
LLGSVENLQQRIDSVSHTSVQVRLGALNVVVQVVTESLDHIDSLVLLGLREVSIEQNYNKGLVLRQFKPKNRFFARHDSSIPFQRQTRVGFNHEIEKNHWFSM